jgi:DNA polymerase III subunit delta'
VEEVVQQRPLPLHDWDDLLGHEAERVRLANAGPFPSLLFSGPQGLGKSLLAVWFAARNNCENPRSEAPWACSCKSCRLYLRNAHPDLFWLKRQPGKTVLGVGEARELIQQLFLRPYQARQRVCIIDEADRLTDEAQSALLKTLEEPPPDNLLILVTHQESKLLTTVLSRCRIHRFAPLTDEVLLQWLERLGCPQDAASRYASLAQGCPGRAQELWEKPALWEAQESLLDALAQLPQASLGRTLELAAKLETLKLPGYEGRAQLEWVIGTTQAYYRDVMLHMSGVPHLVHRHREEQLGALAANGDADKLQRWLTAIREAQEFCQANVNGRLLLQNLCLKLSK